MAATLSVRGKCMRVKCMRLTCVILVNALGFASPASADDAAVCLDASDRARAAVSAKRLLEARGQLRICASLACEESVRVLCDERLAEVTARLPTIIFDAKDLDGRDVPSVKLTIDGVPTSEGPLGAEIPLDPGPHVFAFEAAEMAPVEHRFVLVERDKARREHVVIGRASTQPVRTEPAPMAPSATLAAGPWGTAGWVAIGAGAVAMGVGATFGVTAIIKNADAGCDATNVCDDPRSRHEARIAASASTVAFVVGGVVAAAGVGLVLWAPRKVRVGRLALAGSSLSLVRTW